MAEGPLVRMGPSIFAIRVVIANGHGRLSRRFVADHGAIADVRVRHGYSGFHAGGWLRAAEIICLLRLAPRGVREDSSP